MTGTRVDTGQGWTQDVPLWSMLGKSQLQADKECAPGNRGATQGKEQPLPCPEPLSRVAAGVGAFCLHSFHCTWELQYSYNQCHRFWHKASGSYRGKQKHWEGVKQHLGEAPPNHQQNWGGGIHPGHSQHALPRHSQGRMSVS